MPLRAWAAAALTLSLAWAPAAMARPHPAPPPAMPAQTEGQTPHPAPAGGYPYLLFVPRGYNAAAAANWPVIVFLHGSGEAGSDLAKVKVNGPPKLVEHDPAFPFIVISPQTTSEDAFDTAMLEKTLDGALKGLRADPDRIYLTGLSMGGIGTWAWAEADPARFAAIAPVAAEGDTTKACALAKLPTWAFHGDKDDVVPVTGDFGMVQAIRACGGTPRLTIYPDTGHWSWVAAYDDPGLYLWFLHHRRGEAAVTAAKAKP